MEEYICKNPICKNFKKTISEEDVIQAQSGKQCPLCYQPIKTKAQIDAEIRRRKKKKIRRMIIGLIVIIAVPAFIFIFSSLKKNQTVKTDISEKKTEKVNTKIDTISAKPIQANNKQEVVKKETPRNDVPTKNVESKQSNYTLTFSFGYYKGETLNGKMHGYGTLYFNQQQIISPKDPKKRVSEQGDYISGTWYNGFLDQGKWYSKNGEQKGHIIIGH